MKRLLYIILVVPLLFSCDRDPYADFFASREVVEVGDKIFLSDYKVWIWS